MEKCFPLSTNTSHPKYLKRLPPTEKKNVWKKLGQLFTPQSTFSLLKIMILVNFEEKWPKPRF